MKKIALQLVLIFTILLGSCKKEQLDESTPGSVTPPVLRISGNLSKTLEYTIKGSTLEIMPYGYATAVFYPVNDTALVYIDSVKLNDVPLKTNGGSKDYMTDPVTLTSATACNWRVHGNNGIPDFTFDNLQGMPAYTGYSMLPDSIDRTKDLPIPLTGISNTGTITILLDDGITHSLIKYSNAEATPLILTAAELASFEEQGYSRLTILLSNFNIPQISGIRLQFQNTSSFSKSVIFH